MQAESTSKHMSSPEHHPSASSAGVRLLLILPALLLLSTGCVTTQSTPAAPGAPTVEVLPAGNGAPGAPGFTAVPASAHMVTVPPLPPPSPEAAPDVPTGSVWASNSGSLFKDIKASRIGDIVTITVSEEAKGTKTASTITGRTKKFDGLFTFAGAGAGPTVAAPMGAAKFGPYEGQFGGSFDGTGSTIRTDSMSAYMTATVVQVLPNGNLVIRGSRWTKVNDEMQQIIVEGVVRPNDITRNNTVLSQNIADAKIFLVGKGPVAQHQKPGWLLQVLDLFSPF